jgi:hypothetical protein
MEKSNNKSNAKNTNEQQLFLETKNKKRVMGNLVLLGLRKVTAMRKLKADHPLTVKAAKPKIYPKRRGKTKNGLDMGRNKRGYMVLHVLQKVSHGQL